VWIEENRDHNKYSNISENALNGELKIRKYANLIEKEVVKKENVIAN
jgi:hypothetical protein